MTSAWKNYWDLHASSMGANQFEQVQRVENGKPITPEQFQRISEHVVSSLKLEAHHRVLDLCCGNGLLSGVIEPVSGSVVAVDFCESLLREVRARSGPKTARLLADARHAHFRPHSFDRVVLAAAIQHFARHEVVSLFRRVAGFLRPRGIFMVTDIPDNARLWTFFDNAAREIAHFDACERGDPILGTWFDRTWLEKLARYAGFSESLAIDQPVDLPYARYRFDLICRVSGSR